MLSMKKVWDINSSQVIAIHPLGAEMVIVDYQLFSIFEDVGFDKLMKCLQLIYELCSKNLPKKTHSNNI